MEQVLKITETLSIIVDQAFMNFFSTVRHSSVRNPDVMKIAYQRRRFREELYFAFTKHVDSLVTVSIIVVDVLTSRKQTLNRRSSHFGQFMKIRVFLPTNNHI